MKSIAFRVGQYIVCCTVDVKKAPGERGLVVGFLVVHRSKIEQAARELMAKTEGELDAKSANPGR